MKAVGSRVMPQKATPMRTERHRHHDAAAMDHAADQAGVQRSADVIDLVKPAIEELRFSGGTGARSHSAHCVGFSVAALTALISAVAAITSANC